MTTFDVWNEAGEDAPPQKQSHFNSIYAASPRACHVTAEDHECDNKVSSCRKLHKQKKAVEEESIHYHCLSSYYHSRPRQARLTRSW